MTDDLPQDRALADQIAEGLRLHHRLLQIHVVQFELSFEMLDFLKGARIGDGGPDVISEDPRPGGDYFRHIFGTKACEGSQDFSFKNYGADPVLRDALFSQPLEPRDGNRLVTGISCHFQLASGHRFSKRTQVHRHPSIEILVRLRAVSVTWKRPTS